MLWDIATIMEGQNPVEDVPCKRGPTSILGRKEEEEEEERTTTNTAAITSSTNPAKPQHDAASQEADSERLLVPWKEASSILPEMMMPRGEPLARPPLLECRAEPPIQNQCATKVSLGAPPYPVPGPGSGSGHASHTSPSPENPILLSTRQRHHQADAARQHHAHPHHAHPHHRRQEQRQQHPQPQPHHTRRHHRRRVHFAPSIRVQPIPHLDDTPEYLIRATWYDQRDYIVIKQGYTQTVQLMTKGMLLSPPSSSNNSSSDNGDGDGDDSDNSSRITSTSNVELFHCTRGLEHRTRLAHRRRRQLKVSTTRAVLHAQTTCWLHHDPHRHDDGDTVSTGDWDESERAISKAYQEAGAVQCQRAAEFQGLQDEKAIQEEECHRLDDDPSSSGEHGTNRRMKTPNALLSMDCWSGPNFEDVALEEANRNDLVLDNTDNSVVSFSSSSSGAVTAHSVIITAL